MLTEHNAIVRCGCSMIIEAHVWEFWGFSSYNDVMESMALEPVEFLVLWPFGKPQASHQMTHGSEASLIKSTFCITYTNTYNPK
jgi:hypothetical protein